MYMRWAISCCRLVLQTTSPWSKPSLQMSSRVDDGHPLPVDEEELEEELAEESDEVELFAARLSGRRGEPEACLLPGTVEPQSVVWMRAPKWTSK